VRRPEPSVFRKLTHATVMIIPELRVLESVGVDACGAGSASTSEVLEGREGGRSSISTWVDACDILNAVKRDTWRVERSLRYT